MLLPPSLDELVPVDHLTRMINELVDEMELGGNSTGPTRAAERETGFEAAGMIL